MHRSYWSSSDMTTAALWIASFLRSRELPEPDGRPLYAYRCTASEFETLRGVLKESPVSEPHFRAFVLYAAQWWQRQYDGGRWAWEPLLGSIGWSTPYTDLYSDVRRAWRWWKVEPVRLPSSTRFLGTFACHGGLPLALVGNAKAPITLYLRAVLGHRLEYGRFVDDTIDLAKDKEHLLRPPTLRRDYVFRLAADVVDAVVDLQHDATGEDPIAALDRDRPAWRDGMPLDLDNALARDLLRGLLRDAAQGLEMPVDDFNVRRFLRLTSIGWRLGARVQLPPSISAVHLAHQLGADGDSDLPARMEVRVSAKDTHVLGIYDYSGDHDGEYRLVGRQAQPDLLWDEGAAGEMRLQFLAGYYVGRGVIPRGGASLGDLPWAFRGDDDECQFIGEGTVSNRAPEIVVLMPESDERFDGVLEGGAVLDRAIWRVRCPITIQTEFGACTIRPGAREQPADDYLLQGDRWYDADCAYPLYKGAPKLYVSKSGSLPKLVPAHEVRWRQQGGDWQQTPNNGLWQIRHVVGDELRCFRRIGILPDGMAMKLKPGSAVGEGSLAFTGAEKMRVTTNDARFDVHEDTNGLRVALKANDQFHPPTTIKLKLHWPGTSDLRVVVPFPGKGGQFLRGGELVQKTVAADDLYGVRAVALSPLPSDKFWVEGELKALDLKDLGKVAHFRKPLRRVGDALHELPLIDARALIDLLLSASPSSDARVDLRVVNKAGEPQCQLQVSRFAAVLEHDATNAFVELSPPPEGSGEWSFHALPIARPDQDPLTLDTGDRPDSRIAALPDLRPDGPWLVIARRDGRVCAQPAEVSQPPRSTKLEVRDSPPLRLEEAARITEPTRRRAAVQLALQEMLDGGVDDMDEEWEFLMQTLVSTDDLPPSSVDVLVGLTRIPRLLVRGLFRVDSVPRQRLWRIDRELPFSWPLVKRHVWRQEARAAFNSFQEALEDAGQDDATQTAREHISSTLAEGVQDNAGLKIVGFDAALHLAGGRLTHEFEKERKQARDEAISSQIILRNGLDDWPAGDGRTQWTKEIGYASVLNALWQEALAHQHPLLDTPVAAACYSLLPPEPTRRAVYLVRRMRTHDQEWFDIAYGAAWTRLAVALDGINAKGGRP